MQRRLTVGSLFAGIGGFDLAAERAGLEVRWQVEIDDYANRVLAKHWPGVRRYRDIRAIDWSDVEPVDLVCGGFPCQPHSLAGRRAASDDDRDLWPEVVRCLRGLRPRWFLGENVSGLLSSEAGRFFGAVLRDLAASGYDAEWDGIPASAVGAPHRRDRVWILAYPHGSGFGERWGAESVSPQFAGAEYVGQVVADADGDYRFGRGGLVQVGRLRGAREDALDVQAWRAQWATEPDVGRVAHGVPARVDRLRGLGNAIVPQVAEWIFRRIIEADGEAQPAEASS